MKSIRSISIMFCLFILLCGQINHAWAENDRHTFAKLGNGLKIHIIEDHRSVVVMSSILYQVGGADESVEQAGVSHMLEHMMFKGTAKHGKGEFNKKIDFMGGISNAFTSGDVTGYWARYPSQHLMEWLTLEADRMQNLSIDEKELSKERMVVLEERKMRVDDNPWGRLYEAYQQYAFVPKPYFTPVVGYTDNILHYSKDQLEQWYRRYYKPNNATIILIGDVKADQAIDQIKSVFGDIKASATPKIVHEINNAHAYRRVQLSRQQKTPLLMMGYQVPILRSSCRKNNMNIEHGRIMCRNKVNLITVLTCPLLQIFQS